MEYFVRRSLIILRIAHKLILYVLFTLVIAQVDYDSQIQPIFNFECTQCHGNSAGLNLSSYANIMLGSNNGDVVIPYNHSTSELWIRANSGQMPPGNDDLTDEQVGLIAQWIDEGALEEPGSSSGCTDSQAYNCADDFWSCVDDGTAPADCMDAGEWPNYTFLVGTTPYINGCNYDNTDPFNGNLPVYQGGCESGPCEGYYNPGATTDDGSCDYYHAPHGDDVEFTITGDGISLNWTSWENSFAPVNAIINGYHVARCVGEGCVFITDSPFPWGSNDGLDATSIVDEYEWENDVEIKYSINVQYSNAESYGMAIGTSYVTPESSCPDLGDMNGDGGYNVLDIVALANCVLADTCGS